jgi:hypothetical protein
MDTNLNTKSNGSYSVNQIKRQRIQELHRKLHSNIKVKTEDTKIQDHTSNDNNGSNHGSKVRRVDIKRYLGEPLPLPYLINKPQEQLQQHASKPKRDSTLFKREKNAILQGSLNRLRDVHEPQMIDQSVQTDSSIELHYKDLIVITNEDQIKTLMKEFHKINEINDINPQTNLLKNTLSSPAFLIVLLCILYFTVYLLKMKLS